MLERQMMAGYSPGFMNNPFILKKNVFAQACDVASDSRISVIRCHAIADHLISFFLISYIQGRIQGIQISNNAQWAPFDGS